jgi:phage shock protein PspC (stress-responsive transcriptional regulator)
MKKTLTINISGIVFHIDEDAYEILQKYIDAVSNSFSDKNENIEVMSDIEARIAELFQERLGTVRQVVTLEDVDGIIEILGKPEDFEPENQFEKQDYKEKYSASNKTDWKTGRRLYRDLENAVIGGVGAGLGAYFGIDTIVIRIILALSFFIAGPLIYLILWIVVPAARTSAQKLEMRGEKVNLENIERQVREEFENIKRNFDNLKKKDNTKLEAIFNEFLNVFIKFIKPIAIIIAIIFSVFIIMFIITLLSKILGHTWNSIFFNFSGFNILHDLPFPALLSLVISSQYVNLVITGLVLVILIPIISIFFSIMRAFMGWKRVPFISGLFGLLTLTGIVLLAIVIVSESTNFKAKGKTVNEYNYNNIQDTLHIALSHNPYYDCLTEDQYEYNDNCGHYYDWKNFLILNEKFKILAQKGKVSMEIAPQIIINRNNTNSVQVKIVKQSLGTNMENAKQNTTNINYDWTLKNNKLEVEPYFSINNDDKWRKQSVKMIVNVPSDIIINYINSSNIFIEE